MVVVVGGGMGAVIFVFWSRRRMMQKKNMYDVGGHERKKMPFLKYPFPSPTSVNIINAALAIKQTVSQLRERINADQEWRS